MASIRSIRVWLWLTALIAVLLGVAAGGGVFIDDLYRDIPYFVAQAVGQDFLACHSASRSYRLCYPCQSRFSARKGNLVGVLVYLVYTYVVAAFDVKFNSFFLVYVALLGCSLYALVGGLATVNMAEIKACFTEKTPAKPISIYLAVLAVLFYFLWLSEIFPALMAGKIPQSILDNGTPTSAIHVLDMAWILPAFSITAVSLWRKQALGYTLAGVPLSYSVLLISAILGMVVVMIRVSTKQSREEVLTLFLSGVEKLEKDYRSDDCYSKTRA
jgi:hypothetical protein